MAPKLYSDSMGNTFTECINPQQLTEVATGAAGQLFERKLRTGNVDESDVLDVLSGQLKQLQKKLKLPDANTPTSKDIFNVSRLKNT